MFTRLRRILRQPKLRKNLGVVWEKLKWRALMGAASAGMSALVTWIRFRYFRGGKMTKEDAARVVNLVAMLAGQFADRTENKVDDEFVELLEAIASSPQLLQWIVDRFDGDPAT